MLPKGPPPPARERRPPPDLERFEMICVFDAMPHALKLLTVEEHLSHATKVVAPLADTSPQALKPLGLKAHLHMPQNLYRHC